MPEKQKKSLMVRIAMEDGGVDKVEIFLEQREVAFLSPSKICENLTFSTKIQIFANFAGW